MAEKSVPERTTLAVAPAPDSEPALPAPPRERLARLAVPQYPSKGHVEAHGMGCLECSQAFHELAERRRKRRVRSGEDDRVRTVLRFDHNDLSGERIPDSVDAAVTRRIAGI